jgi:hypothetical protein
MIVYPQIIIILANQRERGKEEVKGRDGRKGMKMWSSDGCIHILLDSAERGITGYLEYHGVIT